MHNTLTLLVRGIFHVHDRKDLLAHAMSSRDAGVIGITAGKTQVMLFTSRMPLSSGYALPAHSALLIRSDMRGFILAGVSRTRGLRLVISGRCVIAHSLGGVRDLDIFHRDGSLCGNSGRRIRHGLNDVAADGIDQAIFYLFVDVDKEVGGGRVGGLVVFEDFVEVLNLSHVFVVVLSPDVFPEIVDVDPIVAEGNRSMVHEDRVQSIGEPLILGELRADHLLGVVDVPLDICRLELAVV